jgi:hypothetical protein
MTLKKLIIVNIFAVHWHKNPLLVSVNDGKCKFHGWFPARQQHILLIPRVRSGQVGGVCRTGTRPAAALASQLICCSGPRSASNPVVKEIAREEVTLIGFHLSGAGKVNCHFTRVVIKHLSFLKGLYLQHGERRAISTSLLLGWIGYSLVNVQTKSTLYILGLEHTNTHQHTSTNSFLHFIFFKVKLQNKKGVKSPRIAAAMDNYENSIQLRNSWLLLMKTFSSITVFLLQSPVLWIILL